MRGVTCPLTAARCAKLFLPRRQVIGQRHLHVLDATALDALSRSLRSEHEQWIRLALRRVGCAAAAAATTTTTQSGAQSRFTLYYEYRRVTVIVE